LKKKELSRVRIQGFLAQMVSGLLKWGKASIRYRISAAGLVTGRRAVGVAYRQLAKWLGMWSGVGTLGLCVLPENWRK
jgi:hypothetical protein